MKTVHPTPASKRLNEAKCILTAFLFLGAFLNGGTKSTTPYGEVLVQLSERPALEVQIVKGLGGEKLVVLALHPAEEGNALVRYNVDLATRAVETIPLPELDNSFSLGNAYLLFNGRILGAAVDFDNAGYAFTILPDGEVRKKIVSPEDIFAADLACPPALPCPDCQIGVCFHLDYDARSNHHEVYTSQDGEEWAHQEVEEPAGNLDFANGGTGAAGATTDGTDAFLTYTGRTEEASNPGFVVSLSFDTGETQFAQGPRISRPRFFNPTYGADSESVIVDGQLLYPVVNDDRIDLLKFDTGTSQLTSMPLAPHSPNPGDFTSLNIASFGRNGNVVISGPDFVATMDPKREETLRLIYEFRRFLDASILEIQSTEKLRPLAVVTSSGPEDELGTFLINLDVQVHTVSAHTPFGGGQSNTATVTNFSEAEQLAEVGFYNSDGTLIRLEEISLPPGGVSQIQLGPDGDFQNAYAGLSSSSPQVCMSATYYINLDGKILPPVEVPASGAAKEFAISYNIPKAGEAVGSALAAVNHSDQDFACQATLTPQDGPPVEAGFGIPAGEKTVSFVSQIPGLDGISGNGSARFTCRKASSADLTPETFYFLHLFQDPKGDFVFRPAKSTP